MLGGVHDLEDENGDDAADEPLGPGAEAALGLVAGQRLLSQPDALGEARRFGFSFPLLRLFRGLGPLERDLGEFVSGGAGLDVVLVDVVRVEPQWLRALGGGGHGDLLGQQDAGAAECEG